MKNLLLKPRVKLFSSKYILCFVLFCLWTRLDFIGFIPSERLKSWFPPGGRLRQSGNLDTINSVYLKFIIDLLRRKRKS